MVFSPALPYSMPWYIADRMGFFDELNIDVEYESFIGGPAMMRPAPVGTSVMWVLPVF